MATELDAVLTCEIGDAVSLLPVEYAFLGLGRLGLHGILGGNAVELPLDEGHLIGIGDIAVIDSDTDHEIVLVGVL